MFMKPKPRKDFSFEVTFITLNPTGTRPGSKDCFSNQYLKRYFFCCVLTSDGSVLKMGSQEKKETLIEQNPIRLKLYKYYYEPLYMYWNGVYLIFNRFQMSGNNEPPPPNREPVAFAHIPYVYAGPDWQLLSPGSTVSRYL